MSAFFSYLVLIFLGWFNHENTLSTGQRSPSFTGRPLFLCLRGILGVIPRVRRDFLSGSLSYPLSARRLILRPSGTAREKCSRVSSSVLESCWLEGCTLTARGSPRTSQITDLLLPILPLSTGHLPLFFPTKRGLDVRGVHTKRAPVYPLEVHASGHALLQETLKDALVGPILKIFVQRGSRGEIGRGRLPLDSRAGHVEDAVGDGPLITWWPASGWPDFLLGDELF